MFATFFRHKTSLGTKSPSPDPAPGFAIPLDLLLGVHEVSDDVASILRLLSDRSIDVEVCDFMSEMKENKEELKKGTAGIGWNCWV
ncbi:hypothetical protein GYH30_021499 [Glycine max]|nr:hypothetical protein GYH30_021499 [Glycine max]